MHGPTRRVATVRRQIRPAFELGPEYGFIPVRQRAEEGIGVCLTGRLPDAVKIIDGVDSS
jgi:hypothetical protein